MPVLPPVESLLMPVLALAGKSLAAILPLGRKPLAPVLPSADPPFTQILPPVQESPRAGLAVATKTGAIACPARNDPFQPLHYGERLAKSMSNARLEVIPEASHFLPEDAPEALGYRAASFVLQG
jgi:pimeloyl-ACP methyl ester carboxylesterase